MCVCVTVKIHSNIYLEVHAHVCKIKCLPIYNMLVLGKKIVSVLHLVKLGPGKCPKLPIHNMLGHVTICHNTSIMRLI